MSTEPIRQDDDAGEDVEGHLRMTDEQLAAGTTPRDAVADTKATNPQPGGGR